LYPSELVTIGLLYALKGCGDRAFYRGLIGGYRPLFRRLPERTRLFRALTARFTLHTQLELSPVTNAAPLVERSDLSEPKPFHSD